MVILDASKNRLFRTELHPSLNVVTYLYCNIIDANYHDTDHNEKINEKKIRFISYQSHVLKDQIAHLSDANRKLVIINQYCYSLFLDYFHLRFPGTVFVGWATAVESSPPSTTK